MAMLLSNLRLNSSTLLIRKDTTEVSLPPPRTTTRYLLIASPSSLDIALSSVELYKCTPEISLFMTLTTYLDVPQSVPYCEVQRRMLRRNTMSEAEGTVRDASFTVEASFPCASLYRRFRAQEQLATLNDARVVTSGELLAYYLY